MRVFYVSKIVLTVTLLLAATISFASPQDLHRCIEAAKSTSESAQPEKRSGSLLRAAVGERLRKAGREKEAVSLLKGKVPEQLFLMAAGNLGLALEETGKGIELIGLVDLKNGNDLLAAKPGPLFTLNLRRVGTKKELELTAAAGWRKVDIQKTPPGCLLSFKGRRQPGPKQLTVELKATCEKKPSRLKWRMNVENKSEAWTLWRACFPRLTLRRPGEEAKLFIPRGPGEVTGDIWKSGFKYKGSYPGGWMAPMPFMAVYSIKPKSGLYAAIHDPHGATKDLTAGSLPGKAEVLLSWDVPVPGMSEPGNDYELAGHAVWQLLRGNWYDAAMVYRKFVRTKAHWFPELTSAGRADSPLWLRELCAWTIGGGGMGPAKLADYLGLPVGHHWYNWHSIPFDNDYPHYFPPDEGFAGQVEKLQENSVHVMPYINGRLWDTLDKGQKDWKFTKVALPAAAKKPNGDPWTETYGGEYEDGTPIRLAPMCATTKLWQNKVKSIVLRLLKDFGTHAVYIDQVAAAAPPLCFDAGHGHPLGGGHWWVDGYHEMISAILEDMPEGRALTTECNGEVYVDLFDAYLTWHWQYPGMVPAFPAIYGGAIQMFGRAYRGGPTRDKANRMKMGQQLVFGEQLGWIGANIARDKVNGPYFRNAVRLRHRLRRYFYAGEMARPLVPGGEIPDVTADWQWRGEWPVTLPAVQTGTWKLPSEEKVVFIFANVSMKKVKADISFSGAGYGLSSGRLHRTIVTANGRGETGTVGQKIDASIDLPAGTVLAWELQAAD